MPCLMALVLSRRRSKVRLKTPGYSHHSLSQAMIWPVTVLEKERGEISKSQWLENLMFLNFSASVGSKDWSILPFETGSLNGSHLYLIRFVVGIEHDAEAGDFHRVSTVTGGAVKEDDISRRGRKGRVSGVGIIHTGLDQAFGQVAPGRRRLQRNTGGELSCQDCLTSESQARRNW